YLDKRFSEPSAFAFFQAEYLAALWDLKNEDVKWQERRILEEGRNKEYAFGLNWVRVQDSVTQNSNATLNVQGARGKWNSLNDSGSSQVSGLVSQEQRSGLTWPLLDFDPRLKSGSPSSLSDSRFKNLDPTEVFNSFIPPNPNVHYGRIGQIGPAEGK